MANVLRIDDSGVLSRLEAEMRETAARIGERYGHERVGAGLSAETVRRWADAAASIQRQIAEAAGLWVEVSSEDATHG